MLPGLLGAAPAIPLLANPALSAALLQILLQNQAKVQQVLQPYRNVRAELVLAPVVLPLSSFPPGVFCSSASLSGKSSVMGSGAVQLRKACSLRVSDA